jgi:hypothetical protein
MQRVAASFAMRWDARRIRPVGSRTMHRSNESSAAWARRQRSTRPFACAVTRARPFPIAPTHIRWRRVRVWHRREDIHAGARSRSTLRRTRRTRSRGRAPVSTVYAMENDGGPVGRDCRDACDGLAKHVCRLRGGGAYRVATHPIGDVDVYWAVCAADMRACVPAEAARVWSRARGRRSMPARRSRVPVAVTIRWASPPIRTRLRGDDLPVLDDLEPGDTVACRVESHRRFDGDDRRSVEVDRRARSASSIVKSRAGRSSRTCGRSAPRPATSGSRARRRCACRSARFPGICKPTGEVGTAVESNGCRDRGRDRSCRSRPARTGRPRETRPSHGSHRARARPRSGARNPKTAVCRGRDPEVPIGQVAIREIDVGIGAEKDPCPSSQVRGFSCPEARMVSPS